MAVGDAVNINLGSSGTSYQPASGVEVMVLQVFRSNTFATRIGFTDGTLTTSTYVGATAGTANRTADWRKFIITNGQYYWQNGSAQDYGFSGIQIK
jgi:hypothetical protein